MKAFAALNESGMYHHIYPTEGQTAMCGGYNTPKPIPVTVALHEDGPYWAWQDTGASDFNFIFTHRTGVSMCFPYGVEVEIKAGKGSLVRVNVTPRDA